MTTARDLITSAMKKAGVLTKGMTPDAEEASDGLNALNQLLSLWSTERLLCVSLVDETFALTGGDGTYTMGIGGDFNTAKPMKVTAAFVRSGNTDYPLEIIGAERFASIGDKSTQGSPADYLYVAYGATQATLNLWPIPNSGWTLGIQSWKALSSIASLDTVLTLADGWEMALVTNLAAYIAPDYGVSLPQETLLQAAASKRAIKTMIAAQSDYTITIDRTFQHGKGFDVNKGY